MTERATEISGISWIVGFLGAAVFLILGIIPAKYLPFLYLAFVLPVGVFLFLCGICSAMAGKDEDPEDDDAFISYAYRAMPCNIFHEEYAADQEDEDDSWQINDGNED
jgi:hypothetical protein